MSDTLDININGVRYPTLCGTCKEPITFVGKGDVDSGDAGCVACGNVDKVKEVARLATDYAKSEMQLALNRALKKTAAKSKIMTFDGKTSHNKSHRFVVDLKA